jgi:hypothetical protein
MDYPPKYQVKNPASAGHKFKAASIELNFQSGESGTTLEFF